MPNWRTLACLAVLAAPSLSGQAPPPDPGEALATARRHLQDWRRSNQAELMDDWGQLARYRDANARLRAPRPGEDRVVFLGDSITEIWDLAASFPGRPYVNRGISGQTTGQMLLRFRQDVVALHPRAVVILAGTNDLAGNTGPIALEDIEANLASLTDLAVANGIRPVLCTVLPVHNDTPASRDYFVTRPLDRIRALDDWIRSHCERNRLDLADLHAATLDGRGQLKRTLADDGLHPNAAGFAVVAPLVEAALRKALAR
ncbi:GDSL-type esterase/lipase family protein [Mesoterricola silvestris]|uniref:Lipase n=1 Tax=Mesoterricola silvestris TaxID=2927979 RepID=A0AA48KBH0_9BACT|nr:GDSL-type esterase/lipase family protein [Mesoterricola silvestris]BDU72518.1 lipase [Mesoterricola silvestris]